MAGFFIDRHVVTALLVAPVLAILAWFGVDAMVAEQAETPRAGASYPLLAASNCRRPGGRCDLTNADLIVSVTANSGGRDTVDIRVTSTVPLSGVTIATFDGDGERHSVMQPAVDDASQWTATFTPQFEGRLRLIAKSGDATFYSESSAAFLTLVSDRR